MILGDAPCIYSIEVPMLLVNLVGVGELSSLGCRGGSRLNDCMKNLVRLPRRGDVIWLP